MTALGFGLGGGIAERTAHVVASAAQEAGYRTFWLNQPVTGDALPTLGRLAQTLSIPLGVGVIPLSSRGPQAIMHGVRDAGLPEDRLRLGIGSGDGGQPLRRVQTAVDRLRVGSRAELVLGAVGPKMCALAGELADAVLLTHVTPEGARQRARHVREAADRAGRPRPRIYVYVRVALGTRGLAALEREADSYGRVAAAVEPGWIGMNPLGAAVRATAQADVRAGLGQWAELADEVVVRALGDGDETDIALAVLEAARHTF